MYLARKISEKNVVLISEYTAPKDFVEVFVAPNKLSAIATKEDKNKIKYEKVFVYKKYIEKFKCLENVF